MIRTLIVEDQRLHREYLEREIGGMENIELLPSITDAELAVTACERRKADLVIMDIYTGGRFDGIDAAERIRSFDRTVKIILVTSMLDADCLVRARKAGVDSMWYKDTSEESLMDIIDRTMAGECIFPDHSPSVNVGYVQSDEFTAAENDILRELVNGLTSKQISEKLKLSARTVDWHIKNLLEKTGLPNRTALAIQAARGNLFVIKEETDQETK